MFDSSRGRVRAAALGFLVTASILVIAACDDGYGNDDPEPRLNTTLLEFGDVAAGASEELTFTLTNAGGGVLTGTFAGTNCDAPTASGDTACWSLQGETAYQLYGGQSKTFTVRFAPYSVSVNGGDCGLGNDRHCQIESAHGVVHCHANGVTP